MARPARKPLPLNELACQYCWSMADMARLLGHTYHHLRDHLVDADDNPVTPTQIPGGGQAWCLIGGRRLPCQKDVGGSVTFWRLDVEPVLSAGGRAFHPAGVDL